MSIKLHNSYNLKIYLISVTFYYFSLGGFNLLQSLYLKELKISDDFLGLIISSRTFVHAFFAFFAVIIINRLGKKKTLIYSAIATCILTIFFGISTNKIILLIIAIIQGLTISIFSVTEAPFLSDNSDKQISIKAFSYTFSINMFSMMLSYLLFGKLASSLSIKLNYLSALRYSILISGLVGLIFVTGAAKIDEKKNVLNSKLEGLNINKIKNLIRKSIVTNFLIFNFIIGFGAGLVVPYFNVYLRYRANLDTDKVGVLMALSTFAMALGSLITPKLAAKFGRANTLLISQILSIPFLLLMTNTDKKFLFYVSFILRSGFMNMSMPLAINLAMDIVDSDSKHIMSSLINIFANISRAVSAALAGYIMANCRNGFEIPYFLTAGLYIVALLFAYKKILPYV